MVDDVALNKVATVERCLARVREAYGDGTGLDEDVRRKDALVLNLLRACATTIDLAMHAVPTGGLGVPQSSRNAFARLAHASVITPHVGDELQHMVGLRNVAVPRYQDLDLALLHSIVRDELGAFEAFTASILQRGSD